MQDYSKMLKELLEQYSYVSYSHGYLKAEIELNNENLHKPEKVSKYEQVKNSLRNNIDQIINILISEKQRKYL